MYTYCAYIFQESHTALHGVVYQALILQAPIDTAAAESQLNLNLILTHT